MTLRRGTEQAKVPTMPSHSVSIIFFLVLCCFSFTKIQGAAKKEDVKFYSYPDAETPDVYKTIVTGDSKSLKNSGMVPGKVTILIHGFHAKLTTMDELKNGYLSEGFKNVVIVDWSKIANGHLPDAISFLSYGSVLKQVPDVGERIAEFIVFLKDSKIISGGDDVHLIGHSLGAHLSGATGQHLKDEHSITLDRITGLDPAGPMSTDLGEYRLNKDQAKFVEAVHSDIGLQGIPDQLGDVDFYLNGGNSKDQPRCHNIVPLTQSACAHYYAVKIFARSIYRTTVLHGCKCKPVPMNQFPFMCGAPQAGTCDGKTRFGEYGSRSAKGPYYVAVE